MPGSASFFKAADVLTQRFKAVQFAEKQISSGADEEKAVKHWRTVRHL